MGVKATQVVRRLSTNDQETPGAVRRHRLVSNGVSDFRRLVGGFGAQCHRWSDTELSHERVGGAVYKPLLFRLCMTMSI